MPVDYDDLITDTELETAALKSMAGITVATNSVAMIDAIGEATDRIEEFFDRFVIVRSYTQRIPANAWRYNRMLGLYVAWASDKPVVEVKTLVDVNGVAISGMTVSRDKSVPHGSYDLFTTEQPQDVIVTYYAGYRREAQNLAALTGTAAGEGSLTTLTVLPSEYQRDIRRKCIELSLLYLRRALEGTLGSGRRTQQVGTNLVTVEAIDLGAEDRIIESLSHYRRLV